MIKAEFKYIRDVGEASLYVKLSSLVVIATDDFGVAGPSELANQVYDAYSRSRSTNDGITGNFCAELVQNSIWQTFNSRGT